MDPNSRLAKACRHTVSVGLPEGGEYFPGGTTYIASMTALMLIAMRVGRIRETISGETYLDMRQALLDYAHDFQKEVEGYTDRAFALAQTWKDLRAEDFIGDYSDYATAFFGSAKIIETFGGYTTYDDSEDCATSTISWASRRPSAGGYYKSFHTFFWEDAGNAERREAAGKPLYCDQRRGKRAVPGEFCGVYYPQAPDISG